MIPYTSSNQTETSTFGFDYLDLFLIHAPWPWGEKGSDYTEGNIASWKAMEELYKEGKIRAIGVSNFSESDIQAILDHCEIVPMVNQIRLFPGHMQEDLTTFCRKHNILLEAYSPLATGRILDNTKIMDIEKKYKVSVAQICIRYLLQIDLLPLPKTIHPAWIAENAAVDFVIGDEDIT